MRYMVVKGSQSAHCCFEATVVDTSKPVMIDGEQYKGESEPICECIDIHDAYMIANAMNLAFEQFKLSQEAAGLVERV